MIVTGRFKIPIIMTTIGCSNTTGYDIERAICYVHVVIRRITACRIVPISTTGNSRHFAVRTIDAR